VASRERRGGFTLIESLVALAITSLTVLSAVALMRDSLFYFDRGSRAVDQTEQFALAVDCMTRDFGAARFVQRRGGDPKKATFIGDDGGRVLFVTGGDKAPGSQGEEVVEYSIEQNDKVSQLVRRRSAWPGPRLLLNDADLQDPVVLLKGDFDISFQYSDYDSSGELVWRDTWAGGQGIPRSARLTLRDRESGADLLSDGDFLVGANAPMACDTDKDCLSPAKEAPAPPQRQVGTE
jgi:prepilin-type N-terminal cleavage/methylation domain-containing protein